MSRNIVVIIVIIVVAFFGYKLFTNKPLGVSDDKADLILYWGDGCPHCEKVKQYIVDNKLDTKVKISYKEVYYNKTNQQQLTDTVKKCPEIDTSQGIGVPLAYDKANSKCISGDQPIIDWLNARVLK